MREDRGGVFVNSPASVTLGAALSNANAVNSSLSPHGKTLLVRDGRVFEK